MAGGLELPTNQTISAFKLEVTRALSAMAKATEQANMVQVVNAAALVKVLEDKGLITREEFEAARAVVSAEIDQEVAEYKTKRGETR